MNLPKAWSYSSLTRFETCPYQYHQTKVVNAVIEEETEPQRWGKIVHEALEVRVRDGTPLPEGVAKYEPLAAMFDGKPGVTCEKQYLLDEKLRPVDNKEDAWCIGIIDVERLTKNTAHLYDWKTGKKRPDSNQMQLYSGLVMQHNEAIKVVKNTYVWLLSMEEPTTEKFTRDDLPAIWQNFIPRVNRLEQAYEKDKWPCRPSGLCRGWCPVRHCKYYEPKRNPK